MTDVRPHIPEETLIDLAAGVCPAAEEGDARRHIAECDACRAVFQAYEKTWRNLGEWLLPDRAAPALSAQAILAEAAERPNYLRFAVHLALAAAALWMVFFAIPMGLSRQQRGNELQRMATAGPVCVTSQGVRSLAVDERLVTGAQERADVRLPDGSFILLAPETVFCLAASESGVRFSAFVEQGGVEIEASAGPPIRIGVPGGCIETIGTRFAIGVQLPKDSPAEAVSRVEVFEGKVRLDCGSERGLACAGERRVLAAFRDNGTLTGQVGPSCERHTLMGVLEAWRMDTREAGPVWIHAAADGPRPSSGAFVRVEFQRRGGLLFVTAPEDMGANPPKDCSDSPEGPALRLHRACVAHYRTLAESGEPWRLIAAAADLARLKDPLAGPRVLRAAWRVAAQRPDVAQALERQVTKLPQPDRIKVEARRHETGRVMQ
jgi:ferric-dicitrate binding protein FerR (iron transport regulator)